MKLWPFRREKALTGSPGVIDALRNQAWSPYPLLGGGSRQRISDVYSTAQTANYTWMYTNSPAVRTVVDCVRRNVGQLDLRLFEELDEGDREPRPDHPAALSMRYPNETTPADQFIRSLFLDFLVHDNAYALLAPAAGRQLNMWWLPAFRMELAGESIFDAELYRYHNPHNGTYTDFAPGQILHWRGENPHDQRLGLSLLETLRKVVAEDAALQQANVELANSGMQKPVWVFRPLEAPEWSPEARNRAEEDLRNRLRKSTDMPAVLEEGMELRDFGVSPNDAEALDVRKWLLAEVAQAYGVPGPMVGLDGDLEKATASFYADTLPPYCEQFTRALNHLILVRKYGDTDLTFEFNLDEKQMGDERLKTLIAMAGGPIATRNESRSKINLPAVPGGNELLTPANYQVGAKPKPTTTVMPVQDPNRPSQDGDARSTDLPTPQPARDKAIPPVTINTDPLSAEVQALAERRFKELEVTTVPRTMGDMDRQRRNIDKARPMIERYFRRQGQALRSKAVKAANDARWNRELADDIEQLARQIVESEGGIYVARLGGDDFDLRQVEHYLKAMAEGAADGINTATQRDIADTDVGEALDRARSQRAEVIATSIGTRSTVFAREEAAKQSPFPEQRVKTWIPNTDRHAGLAGATVPVDSDWGGITPGSEPGCACSMSVT